MLLPDLRCLVVRPFVLGLSIPIHWESRLRSGGRAVALVERAFERGFDFLLAPRCLAQAFAPAEFAKCAIPGLTRRPGQDGDCDIGARDLVWLRESHMSAEGGVVVSANEESLDQQHAPFLTQQFASVRAASKENEDRCIFLEIEMEGAVSAVANEEDEALESFIASLGKGVPVSENGSACVVKQKINPEELRKFLLLTQDIGFDGVSLALPDPFDDVPFIEKPVARLNDAFQREKSLTFRHRIAKIRS